MIKQKLNSAHLAILLAVFMIFGCGDNCEWSCEGARIESPNFAHDWLFLSTIQVCNEDCSSLLGGNGDSKYSKKFWLIDLVNQTRTNITSVIKANDFHQGYTYFRIDGDYLLASRNWDSKYKVLAQEIYLPDLSIKGFSESLPDKIFKPRDDPYMRKWGNENQWLKYTQATFGTWSQVAEYLLQNQNRFEIIDINSSSISKFDPNEYFQTDSLLYFDDLWSNGEAGLGVVVSEVGLKIYKNQNSRIDTISIPFSSFISQNKLTEKPRVSFAPDVGMIYTPDFGEICLSISLVPFGIKDVIEPCKIREIIEFDTYNTEFHFHNILTERGYNDKPIGEW
jgi:hypothetical protein